MPFTLLAHQAPVLPLKLAHPRAWSGTALVLGSVGRTVSEYGHTLEGQLVLRVPATLALWILRRRLLVEWHPAASPVRPAQRGVLAFWAVVVAGALAGIAWSLAGLDGPHARPLDVAVSAFLRGTSFAFVALVLACSAARRGETS